MVTPPKVSVIVPVCNGEKYLERCLQSMLEVHYKEHEVIVIDDGSSDSTPEILAKAEGLVKVIRQPNSGVSVARNRGIEAAKGSYIMFVDADDSTYPRSISNLVDLLEDTGADIAMGAIADIDTPGTESPESYSLSGLEAAKAMLYQRGKADRLCSLGSVWGKLFRRELLEDVRFAEGVRYEDLDIMWRLFVKAKKVAWTPTVVYHYRHHQSSFMHSFSRQHLDILDITERLCTEAPPALKGASRSRRFAAACNMASLTSLSGMEEESQECWKIVKALRMAELVDPGVRFKNRLGAALSFLGRNAFLSIASRQQKV